MYNIGKIRFKCYIILKTHRWCCQPGSSAAVCCPASQFSVCRHYSAQRKVWEWWKQISCKSKTKKHIQYNWKNAEGKADLRDGLIAATLPDFFFGFLETFSHKVNWLELCNGILLQAGLLWLEGEKFGLVRQTVLQDIRITFHFQSVIHFSHAFVPHCHVSAFHSTNYTINSTGLLTPFLKAQSKKPVYFVGLEHRAWTRRKHSERYHIPAVHQKMRADQHRKPLLYLLPCTDHIPQWTSRPAKNKHYNHTVLLRETNVSCGLITWLASGDWLLKMWKIILIVT